jgi:phosphoribosylanthranilate isomerase
MSVLIKYCGCKSAEEYKMLIATKADVIGFIFADSRRKVDPDKVSSWLKRTRTEKKIAGVFRNSPLDEIVSIANHVPLDIIQCHGDEPAEALLQLKEQSGKMIIKAIPFNEKVIEEIGKYSYAADAIIVDSALNGQFGGTGVTFSWSRVPAILKAARKWNIPCLIAGGINSSNVKELLSFKPDGIDLSGGIETDGKKCIEKIKEFEGKCGL